MIGVYILPISEMDVKFYDFKKLEGNFLGKVLFGKEIKIAEPRLALPVNQRKYQKNLCQSLDWRFKT